MSVRCEANSVVLNSQIVDGPHKFVGIVTNDMRAGCLACEHCGETRPLPMELIPKQQ